MFVNFGYHCKKLVLIQLYLLAFASSINFDGLRNPKSFGGIFRHRRAFNPSRCNRYHLAIIPFGWDGSNDDSNSNVSDHSKWNWTTDKYDYKRKESCNNNGKEPASVTFDFNRSVNREYSEDPSTNTYRKVIEGLSPKLFVLRDTFDGNNNRCVKMGKEQANRLGLLDGGFVKIKGRRRRSTVCVVRIDESIINNETYVHSDIRRNLRLRNGDILSIEACTNIPDVKIARILPFNDTILPIVKGIPDGNRKIKQLLNNVLLDYFTKEIERGKKSPIKMGDHLNVFVKFDKNKSKLSILPNGDTDPDYYKIEFKVVDLRSYSGVYKSEFKILRNKCNNLDVVETDTGLITGDSIIDTNGTALSRERDDESYGEVGYDDIGGIGRQLSKIRELIELPLLHPELFRTVGINPPKGVILHGPPGSGKTLIAKAIAAETGATCYVINGPEIMSKHVGESEAKLRRTFEKASNNGPAIIFIDEIDSIATKREKSTSELERRIVSQLLTLMDGITTHSNVVVLASTNRINSIDSALRRFGRFDREIEMTTCDENERYEILKVKTRGMSLAPDVSLRRIAKECHGYVGADIAQLCFEAAMCCIRENVASIDLIQFEDTIPPNILNKLVIKNSHFNEALSLCNPSTLRERKVEIPETTWEDVGGLEDVKKELIETIQYPVEYPNEFRKFGQTSGKGVLFYGPPGCGKTLLAKAIAHQCNANFISIKGPELLTMWFGESEANVRELFDKARAAAPCILFFDEIDSIAKTRSSGKSGGGSEAADRVINQILTEIDGINVKKPIFIIAATNRPDILDPAITRPGRLGKLIYIPLPDLKSRESIFRAALKNSPLAPDVNIRKMAEKMDGYSGADIAEVCHRAAREAIKESIEAEIKRGRPLKKGEKDPVPYITNSHFNIAMKNARKSVEKSDIRLYESFRNKIANNL